MKVLIVEDDHFVHKVIKRGFAKSKGIETISAFDSEEAWKQLEKHSPDLVLLDIIMPKQNGLDFLQDMRKDKNFKKTDVMIVTNLSGIHNRVKAKKLGVKEYFEKANTDLKKIVNSVEAYAGI